MSEALAAAPARREIAHPGDRRRRAGRPSTCSSSCCTAWAEASTDMPLGGVPDSPDCPFCYASGFAFNSASWSLINALISSVMASNCVHCSL